MKSLIQSFVQFEFSPIEINLSTVLAYAAAGSLCMGWLALLSFSLASMLNPAF